MKMNLKKVIPILLSVILLLVSAIPAMAAASTGKAGQGIGVTSQAPTITSDTSDSKIAPNSTTPPSSSTGTVYLGTYDGNITWAGGILYTDKWLCNSTGSTMTVDAKFGQYKSKSDAENHVNRMTSSLVSPEITLVDSNGNHLQSYTYLPDDQVRSGTFNVTKGQSYYLELNFLTSFYYSGSFQVTQ